jgi:hypothetical protein
MWLMKRNIRIILPDLGFEDVEIELNASLAPKTVDAILSLSENLFIRINPSS